MFGRTFHLSGNKARQYVSGGSGIVLSRAALSALGKAVNRTNGKFWFNKPHGPEDLYTADSLKTIGIRPGRSVDTANRQVFLPLGPEFEWTSKKRDMSQWFYKFSTDAVPGPECCSRQWAASHYVRFDDMYRLDNSESLLCPGHLSEWPHWKHADWARSPPSLARRV
jgi:hypothetical protein